MNAKVLKIEGVDELIKALETMPDKAKPLVEEAMTKCVAMLHDKLAEYPPSTAANQPGRMHIVKRNGIPKEEPMGYYERGRGWWYPLKSPIYGPFQPGQLGKRAGLVRLGSRKSKELKVSGYKLRRTSERLGTKWTTQVKVDDKSAVGEVGTMVSYADYVQGNKQPALFGMRGWKTIDAVLDEVTPQIIATFGEAVNKLAEDFNRGK